ncbi:Hypothetical protein (plasmid) [Pseudomonas putida]|nr:Hypothetical protein [Pseudomonas putida]
MAMHGGESSRSDYLGVAGADTKPRCPLCVGRRLQAISKYGRLTDLQAG